MIRLLLLALLAGCVAEQAPISASDVRVPAPPPGAKMSAGYLTLTNHTRETVVITRVHSPQFGSVSMHESVVEDGVARMRPLPELPLPPGEAVSLEPGGKHLMLMRPTGAPGPLQLDFFAGDTLLLSVQARQAETKKPDPD